MNIAKNGLNKIMSGLFVILFLIIYMLITAAFANKARLWIVTGFFLFGFVAWLFSRMKKSGYKIGNKRAKDIAFLIQFSMFFLQIMLICFLKYTPHVDALYLHEGAKRFAESGDFSNITTLCGKTDYYFQVYPNNWAILFTLSGIYRVFYLLFGFIPYELGAVLSVICINLAGWLTYKTAKLIFNDESNVKPILCHLIFLMHPGFYINAPVFYTDTFSMPFVMGSVYYFIKALKSENIKKFLINTLVAAIIMGLGNSAKGSLAVLLVAFIIYGFMKAGFKKGLCISICSAVALTGFSSFIRTAGIKAGIADEQTLYEKELPLSHWINMSLKENGLYNKEDRLWVNQFPNIDAKDKACRESIKQRITNYGVSGMVVYLGKKIIKTWGDSRFHRSFLHRCQNGTLRRFLLSNKRFALYANTLHYFIILGILASCIGGFRAKGKEKFDEIFFIRLTLAGFTAFFLIWEIKSRYLLNVIPLMIILAIDGVNYVSKFFERRKISETEISEEKIPEQE